MKTLREAIQFSKAKNFFKSVLESKNKAILKLLREDDGSDGDGKYPKPLDEAEDLAHDMRDENEDYRAHLKEAIGKLCESDDPEDHKKAKKILGMLTDRPTDESTDGDGTPGDGEPEPQEKVDKDVKKKSMESVDDDGDGFDGEVEKKAEKENKAYESLKHEMHVLKRKDAVRDLCESENFRPSKTQFEAMLLLPDDKKVKAFIQESKAGTTLTRKIAPRTGTILRESADIPSKAEDFASVLLS